MILISSLQLFWRVGAWIPNLPYDHQTMQHSRQLRLIFISKSIQASSENSSNWACAKGNSIVWLRSTKTNQNLHASRLRQSTRREKETKSSLPGIQSVSTKTLDGFFPSLRGFLKLHQSINQKLLRRNQIRLGFVPTFSVHFLCSRFYDHLWVSSHPSDATLDGCPKAKSQYSFSC